MSEANLPPRDPDSSNLTDTVQTNWFAGWDDFASEADECSEEPGHETLAMAKPVDAQSVDAQSDVPSGGVTDTISADAERLALYAQEIQHDTQDQRVTQLATAPVAEAAQPAWVEHATPQASIDHPARLAEDVSQPTSPVAVPDIADLISLIQELNQCNNALLDRVSQLEDALEQTQTAQPVLMSLMGDDQQQVAQMQQMAQDLETTRSHATQLFEQLDAAHQSSKRQQILTETLSEQLQNSQERVAQLERECALAQQKYTEQVQLLAQSETTRRDLTARLQRQQRYTLQFKAALEKCLEVSPSSLTAILEALDEVHSENADADHGGATGLPRVQRIRPWSSQSDSQFLGKMSGIVSHVDDDGTLQPLSQLQVEADDLQPQVIADGADAPSVMAMVQPPTGLDLSATDDSAMASAQAENITSSEPAVSYTLKGDRPSERLSVQLPVNEPTAAQAGLGLSPEIIKAGVEELQAALNDLWGGQPPVELPQDAEATLWEDLARLIDVSSDDLVRANLAHDGVGSEAGSESETLEATSAPTLSAAGSAIVPFSDAFSQVLTAPSPQTAEPGAGDSASPFLANPTWPSPLVHPLRRPRKLPSLAAVELPRFAN